VLLPVLVAEKRERRRPYRPFRAEKPLKPFRPKSRSSRFVAVIFSLVFLGTGVGVIGALWIFWEYGRNLPQYSQLAQYEPPVVTRIHAGNGALLAEYATEKRVFVPVDEIPQPLIEAFLAAEDKGFYKHFGIDLRAMMRAMFTNLSNFGSGKRPVGASTITQQVAKNFLLSNEVSIERKIREGILAIRMERAFTKDQLLELYMNEIYLGFGSYGVAAAALNYYDKALVDLTLAEMAYLAALPKAPNNYHPVRRYKAAVNRRNWVLGQMLENGFVTAEEAAAAEQEQLKTRPRSGETGADAPYFVEEVRRQMVEHYGAESFYTGGYSVRTTIDPKLQQTADRVMIEGLESLDKRQGWRGPLGRLEEQQDSLGIILGEYGKTMHEGRFPALVTGVTAGEAQITVMTTRDPANPDLVKGVIPFVLADWASPPRDSEGVRSQNLTVLTDALKRNDIIMVQRPADVPDRIARIEDASEFDQNVWALGQVPLVQGALLALDPHTGRVLAMAGGYNAAISEFNRATQAQRQPGSAFKPFVYLAALDNGFSPTTRILDAPLVVDQGPELPKWKPANYSRKFYGPGIMRLGIEQSRNLMTARLAMAIGMPAVQEYASRFGIDNDLPPLLSMSLGAGETTLMQLTAAYGMIANGGSFITPSLVDRVQDRFGATVYRHDSRDCSGCSLAVISADNTEPPELPDQRRRVTDETSAYQMVSMLEGVVRRGTGRQIGRLGLTVAGKTGTTNENTNAWFIGFTPDLVVGVYVGFDIPKSLGKNETGSTAAVPIFADFIAETMRNQAQIPFRRPQGVNLFTINALNGQRAREGDAQAITEAFKPGQRPLAIGSDSAVIDVPGRDARVVAEPLPGLY
jgi:penicillin-binding protein 1A